MEQERTKEETPTRWKCFSCYHIIHDKDLKDGRCPVCGECKEDVGGVMIMMCPLDVVEFPQKDIEDGVRYCKHCGRPIASNGSHSVSVVSRITGYLSEVYTEGPNPVSNGKYAGSAWNHGKMAEFHDRKRYLDIESEKV